MENLCRLCASQSLSLTPIFSIKNGRLLLDMITLICPVKIDISDKLSKAICSLCLKIILDAVDLRERSILSDLSLRSRSYNVDEEKIVKTVKDNPQKITDLIPMESVKIEEEKVTENVINFIDESRNSADDYEQSYGDETEYTEYEPPEKIPKISSDQQCSNCQCHKAHFINHELNEKIKEYFRKPLQKGGKWKCHICQKEYAGHLNNLKEHLSIMHKDIAQMLGVSIKPRPRNKSKNEPRITSSLSLDGSLSDYLEQKSSNQG